MSTPVDMASAAKALVASLLASIVDPADAIRMLSSLASFKSTAVSDSSQIGNSMSVMQSASSDLFRRSAVIALARASSTYQPSSYDDAANIRTIVCNIIDSEILTAADQGEDASYTALKNLRAAVIKDLSSRGANLARIAIVKTKSPMPSIQMAYRLYKDISRDGELVIQANPRHPAFMPVTFKALSQ